MNIEENLGNILKDKDKQVSSSEMRSVNLHIRNYTYTVIIPGK